MAIVCPTVTAETPHDYRAQMERIATFAKRIHVDFADGKLAPVKLISPTQARWPENVQIDLHLMLQKPLEHLETFLRLKPNLIIVHAEAEGDFEEFAQRVGQHGIKTGVALLPQTEVKAVEPALKFVDHVLIFSGDLGHFGGHADMSLLGKASELKELKPTIEIGWDGGINDQNAKQLLQSGVDVLNVGGYIQNADDPEKAYATLEVITKQIQQHEKIEH